MFFHCVMWTRYEQFFGFWTQCAQLYVSMLMLVTLFIVHSTSIIFFYSYVRWHLVSFQMILNFYCGMPVSSVVRCRQRFMIQFDLWKLFVEIFFWFDFVGEVKLRSWNHRQDHMINQPDRYSERIWASAKFKKKLFTKKFLLKNKKVIQQKSDEIGQNQSKFGQNSQNLSIRDVWRYIRRTQTHY